MKNIIFIPAYNEYDKKYELCLETWEYYSNKHDIELIIVNDMIDYHPSLTGLGMFECWNDDILLNGEYDRVLIVDTDTMIRWDAPNIFELFETGNIYGIRNHGEQGELHFNQWESIIDSNVITHYDYINTGIVLYDKEHVLKISKELMPYRDLWIESKLNGTDQYDAFEQTPVNIILQTYYKSNLKFIDSTWNDMIQAKYEDASFIQNSYVWHFTGGETLGGWDNRENLIKQTYEHCKENYITE
jgi:hypothetical protein